MGKCKKCNEDINTDDTSIGCDDFIGLECVISEDAIPFLFLEEGATLKEILNGLVEKIKDQNLMITMLQDQINNCCADE